MNAEVPNDSSRSVSVVVVILAGREYLVRCLHALELQSGVKPLEIIVPYDDSLADPAALSYEFPAVDFVHLEGRHSYAELRSLGFRQARGDVIALTEDHCSPDPDWCRNILELHHGSPAAVGGAVDKTGVDTRLNWAIYLSDFSRYMQPVPEGPAAYLTDCNVSYKRKALASIAELWATEFHETTVNWALQAQGATLLLSPKVVVRQQRTLEWGYALRERYEFGRLFASTRVASKSGLRRVTYAALSVLLPGILIGRVAFNVVRKRRNFGPFVRAFPAILVLNLSWPFGECVGYLTGRPAGRVRPVQGELAAVARAS